MRDRVTLTKTYKTGKGAGVIVAQSGKVRGPYTITVLVGDKRKGYGAPKSRKVAKLGDARAALRGKLGPLRKASNPNEVIRLVLGEGEGATVSETVNPGSYKAYQRGTRMMRERFDREAQERRTKTKPVAEKGQCERCLRKLSHAGPRLDRSSTWVDGKWVDLCPPCKDFLTHWPRSKGNPLNKYYFQRGDGGLIRRQGSLLRSGVRTPSMPLWAGSLEKAREMAKDLHRRGKGKVKITILRVEPDGDQTLVGSVGNPISDEDYLETVKFQREKYIEQWDRPGLKPAQRKRVNETIRKWDEEIEKVERRLGRRRNPSNMADADRLYEDFHGRPPTQTTRVVTRTKARTDLAELGPLTELKVHLLTGKRIKLPYEVDCDDQVMLCSSPDGRQLYFVGGDQTIDLLRLGMSGRQWVKDSMVLGVLEMVTYRTEKGFDKFKLTDYYHELGEESGMQPLLMYDNINGLLSVAGGQYEVRPEGIVN